jgi:hypothetical protein
MGWSAQSAGARGGLAWIRLLCSCRHERQHLTREQMQEEEEKEEED